MDNYTSEFLKTLFIAFLYLIYYGDGITSLELWVLCSLILRKCLFYDFNCIHNIKKTIFICSIAEPFNERLRIGTANIVRFV